MSAVNYGVKPALFNHIKESIEQTPYYNLLGFSLLSLAPGRAEMTAVVGPNHTNPLGYTHGGLVLSLADASMANAVRSLGIKGLTADISTSLIASAPMGSELVGKGQVVKHGRNLAFVTAEVYCGDKLLANAKGTFFIVGEIHLDV